LHCKYCQNWEISQRTPEETENYDLPPDKVVAAALLTGCQSIAYTYSDPVVFYEYTLDSSKLARSHNLRNILVTAGYINQEPLKELCLFTDAANVDLKGISDDYYRRMSEGTLQPVQEAILTMKKMGVWVEITNLIVPTWNDKPEDIQRLCRWIKDNCGPDTPIHFSRFWPMHKLANLPPTPESTMTRAWDIAKKTGLHYVYVGNIPGHLGNNTYCPQCGDLLIKRQGYLILQFNLDDGHCRKCQAKIPGIWS
jgi:pyruvate formate lyase activating enzyme